MDPEAYLNALLQLPRLYTPKVSPDGSWVAWTWAKVSPTAEVFLAPADAASPPLRLTETEQDTWVISWAPDSESLIVAQDQDGDERFQLFRVHRNQPLHMEPLTPHAPNHFPRGGSLHPNERWLVYGANFDVESGEEIQASCVYRLDVKTGHYKLLARPARPAYSVPRLNRQGTHVLYARKDRHPSGRQVWLVDIEGQGDREIVDAGHERKAYASWFPDGKRVLVLAERGGHRRLGAWSRREEELVWLIDDPDRNIEQALVPPNGERIVVIEVREARRRPSLLDPSTGEERVLPESSLNLIPLSPQGEGLWLSLAYGSRQPHDLILHSLDRPVKRPFTSVSRVWERTTLRPSDLSQAEDFRWSAEDGLEIQGWLFRTPHQAKGTIVHVHGGPTYHSEDRISEQIQFLVSRGFHVLTPNYRGSTGFGLAFQEAIKEEGWGSQEQEDIRAGIEALTEQGIAQPGKVGITGTSYGGYSAWCAITRYPTELVAAAAPVCGMTDLVVDYETTRPDLRPYSEEMMGGAPDEVPDRYHDRSPIHFVHKIEGKLLIVQGLQDPNVTPENVRAVRRALDQALISYDVLAFENEGHGVIRPENLRKLYLRLADFFTLAFASERG